MMGARVVYGRAVFPPKRPACVVFEMQFPPLEKSFKLLHQIGIGRWATIHLAECLPLDPRPAPEHLVAIKILSKEATDHAGPGGEYRELEWYQRLDKMVQPLDLPRLFGAYVHKDSQGDHLALALSLYGESVDSWRRKAPSKSLPVPITKIVLASSAEGLRELHRAGLIHTGESAVSNVPASQPGLTLNSFTKTSRLTMFLSETWIVKKTSCPSRRRSLPPALLHLACQSRTNLPSTFPPPTWNLCHSLSLIFRTVFAPYPFRVLARFSCSGNAAMEDGQLSPTGTIAATALRSPEVILGAEPFTKKVDTWALGCMVRTCASTLITANVQRRQAFELLTGHWMFELEAGETWSLDDDHLAKILEFSNLQRFEGSWLEKASRRDEFLDSTGECVALVTIPERAEGSGPFDRKLAPHRSDLPQLHRACPHSLRPGS